MLISKTVIMKWNPANIKYYSSKGYIYTKKGDKFRVNIEDLSISSDVKVQCECNNCKIISNISWVDYKKIVKNQNETYCYLCSHKLFGGEKMRKTKLTNEISFGQYLINNYGEDAIGKYWSNKNIINPYEISYGSKIKVWIKCQNCNSEKLIPPNRFTRQGLGCQKCSDGISYPNKMEYNILLQLGLNFTTEYCPNWIKPKRYDFYFKMVDKEYIIEMDGEFHTKDNTQSKQTKEEAKTIDDYKDKLAKEHNIEVIRIDCQKSEVEYIKDKILHSKMMELFDLSNINWQECEKFAYKSLVKDACNLWNNNLKNTQLIGNELKLTRATITTYLKRGSRLGWCDYNPEIEFRNNSINHSKKVYCIELDEIFNSTREASRKLNIDNGCISKACHGKAKTAGKYHWRYYSEEI